MNAPPTSLPLRRSAPTQKDIAEALNLSQSAVALALNPKHQHRLLPETVAVIQAKAQEMGYNTQNFARILRKGRSHTIGVIFVSARYHSNQERIKHLAQQAILNGFQLIAVDMEWFPNKLSGTFEYLLGYAPEGIIFCDLRNPMPNELDEVKRWRGILDQRGIPSLSLGAAFTINSNTVAADIDAAYRQLTEHHIAQGSRTIRLILPYRDPGYTGSLGHSPLLRARGFRDAILKAGGTFQAEPLLLRQLPPVPAVTAPGSDIVGTVLTPEKMDAFSNMFEMGGYFMEKMIERRDIPDSVMCSNDEIATGAINACIRHGVPVPETVCISGTDNSPLSSTCIVPMSTISQPNLELAQSAIERLVEQIESPPKRQEPVQELVPCELILRKSTLRRPGFPPKGGLRPSRRKAAGSAFSLMELLLSLAILAVILSLALGMYNAARRTSDDAKCVANLRASAQAILSFLHDNNGQFLATSTWFAYPSTNTTRNRSMRDYFGIGPNSAGINDPVLKRDTLLTCPAMKKKYPGSYPQPLNRGYGINYYLYLNNYSGGGAGVPTGGPTNLRNVPSLPAMLLITEAPYNNGILGSLNDNTAKTGDRYLSLPHRGRQNAVFFDGHLEPLAVHDFVAPPSKRLFWGKLSFTD